MNNEEEDAAADDDDDDVAVSMKMLKMMYVDRVCWQPLFGRTPSQVLSEKPQPPRWQSYDCAARLAQTIKSPTRNQSETVGQSVTESGKIYKQGFLWCSTFLSHVNHYLFPSRSLVVVPKNAPRLWSLRKRDAPPSAAADLAPVSGLGGHGLVCVACQIQKPSSFAWKERSRPLKRQNANSTVDYSPLPFTPKRKGCKMLRIERRKAEQSEHDSKKIGARAARACTKWGQTSSVTLPASPLHGSCLTLRQSTKIPALRAK